MSRVVGPRHDEILGAALRFATIGVPAFPCVPGAKTPLTRNGLHNATTDEAVIRRWWARWPHANLAIACGSPGFDVLDVDVRDTGSGADAFEVLRSRGLLAGVLGIVLTPSGGLHVYFPGTDQGCGRLPRHYLDFKSRGGYVLAPPSVIRGEGTYAWHDELTGTGQPFLWAEAKVTLEPRRTPAVTRPASLRTPGRLVRGGRGIAPLAQHVATASEGSRNDLLFWAACEALRSDYPDLSPLQRAAMDAGLDQREVDRTIASALQRYREGKL